MSASQVLVAALVLGLQLGPVQSVTAPPLTSARLFSLVKRVENFTVARAGLYLFTLAGAGGNPGLGAVRVFPEKESGFASSFSYGSRPS